MRRSPRGISAPDHHEYYVTPDDLVASLPQVAAFYDQPFGNSSVVPAYYCASMATECGRGRNPRRRRRRRAVRRQRPLRQADGVRDLRERAAIVAHARSRAGLRRAQRLRTVADRSARRRATSPRPGRRCRIGCRCTTCSRALASRDASCPSSLSSVDVDDPARQQRVTFAGVDAASLVNRMLGFDWKYTLADNDLPKVVGATSLAGLRRRLSAPRRRAWSISRCGSRRR